MGQKISNSDSLLAIQKWALVVQQLAIHFEGRLNLKLNFGEQSEKRKVG